MPGIIKDELPKFNYMHKATEIIFDINRKDKKYHDNVM